MASYISSDANRFYVVLENSYGNVSPASSTNRIPAVSLAIRQQLETAERKDKTGSRTFGGVPPGGRRRTTFELQTYMTSWSDRAHDPAHGPLVQASLGGIPMRFPGAPAGSGSNGRNLVFGAAHGLSSGQAVTYAGEIRFVTASLGPTAVQLNAPFSTIPALGTPIGPTITYMPGTALPSVSIFDYWSPATAIQRLVCGGAINRMTVRVNGDFHQFEFGGLGQDIVDSASFVGGIGQLDSFPPEPAIAQFDYSIIPGHMGQAWIGNTPDRLFTVTDATFVLDNGLQLRTKEFGSSIPRAILPGRRTVSVDFSLFGQDDTATNSLYQAAKQQSPISVMFQLGEQDGQLVGVYLKSVIPEVPEFNDAESMLQWHFRESRAQGTVDDEIMVAFG